MKDLLVGIAVGYLLAQMMKPKTEVVDNNNDFVGTSATNENIATTQTDRIGSYKNFVV